MAIVKVGRCRRCGERIAVDDDIGEWSHTHPEDDDMPGEIFINYYEDRDYDHLAEPAPEYPADHPLHDVNPRALELARDVLQGAVQTKDVDPDMAEPIADAVVLALVQDGLVT